ncbi:hypothetical protein PFISCL1PPCAC_1912 [Pristionchus fissidentatus]|uniref:Phospholipid/glycerol acyltransferase domain-containing protein n=1 Tax=Pristionchus fissidentatus TaxID=1538716 RepID=A0AAV5UWR2_9BILA|nr:hypothetical protein PFISCL1PPCAC_1912 [Pristionchus fissidentatus]
MFGKYNGVVFVILLFITSFLGSIFILIPFIPLAWFAPKLWRQCADRMVGYWLTFPASLCSFVFGVHFHVSGDLIERDEPAIILMNHRTRLDWLFLWNALYRMDPWLLTTEKISLKADLKRIPGAGWAMGCGSYIFLSRRFERDRHSMEEIIRYYADAGRSYQLLLFAEGTDRGTHAIEASEKYAKEHGLPNYEQVVHPRTTGFNYLVDLMQGCNYLTKVYDVTVAYPDHIVQSEVDLFKQGIFPKQIHFDVKAYDISEIPTTEETRGKWLKERWYEKEMRLRKFYDPNSPKEFTPSGKGFRWPSTMTGSGYFAAFAFWILSSVMWIYFIYAYSLLKLYCILSTAFYTYAHFAHGGIEFLVIKWFYMRNTVEKKKTRAA